MLANQKQLGCITLKKVGKQGCKTDNQKAKTSTAMMLFGERKIASLSNLQYDRSGKAIRLIESM
jgi:hypothetical protein